MLFFSISTLWITEFSKEDLTGNYAGLVFLISALKDVNSTLYVIFFVKSCLEVTIKMLGANFFMKKDKILPNSLIWYLRSWSQFFMAIIFGFFILFKLGLLNVSFFLSIIFDLYSSTMNLHRNYRIFFISYSYYLQSKMSLFYKRFRSHK